MDWYLLENISFVPDEEQFFQDMRLKSGSSRRESCRELMQEAQAVARPRALWLEQKIERLDDSGLETAGIRFESSLFQPRLQAGQAIYPFLASAGQEICAWSDNYRDDMVKHYWADALAELALRAAIARLEEDLCPIIGNEYLASFDPGSLTAWPIEQQRPLFQLLGEGAEACGVRLSERCIMQPQKSVSGFYFASKVEYYNCELCPRLRCERRRAEFTG